MSEFKLKIDLVPVTCFCSNVRKVVSEAKWVQIRKRAYRNANYKCEVCGAENIKLHCHEVFRYDDEDYVQYLEGFQALCESCHMIKHAGFSMHTTEGKEKYDRNELIRHFCRVNKCSEEDFLEHEDRAFEIWEERSEHDWKQPWKEQYDSRRRTEADAYNSEWEIFSA